MTKAKKKSGPRRLAGSGLLKMGAGCDLKKSAQRLAVGCCTLMIWSSGYSGQSEVTQRPPATGERAPAGLVPVNRTVPQVEPSKSALEFSPSPTPQELFLARVFEEPLVPVGGEPSPAENGALAAALLGYSKRSGPDDFSSLTGFLETHPQSPWAAALLTDLGLEYHNTAHYSLALAAWKEAWALAKDVTDAKGKAIADRAAGELAYMYARLGRMTELQAFLKTVEGRVFVGAATERISGVRQALWNMQNRPEISFRCGPLALQRIRVSLDPQASLPMEIFNSASTQKGFSLSKVAELSKKVGLDYQMAFRQPDVAFIVPSVVHWKVGHYAAMVRRDGDRFLMQDPTFGNEVWATKAALESETSGYCLVPAGALPEGWRSVNAGEGATVWGKGLVSSIASGVCTPGDASSGGGQCTGMAVPGVHLLMVSLHLWDEPVGYSPPVGPAVRFTVRYNQRDADQPANFTYANFGSKWTCDWISYITDNPSNLLADVKYYVMGGGARSFTSFNTNTQSFAHQQYDETLLTRTGPARYLMLSRDGSKLVFSQSDGAVGTSRKIFLTQVIDPSGNAATLSYDGNLRLIAITDAIGQVTTISYANPTDIYKITKVTDPFGRFATFDYDDTNRLNKITDVIGLASQFTYEGSGDFIHTLITPYGTTAFTRAETNTTRVLETLYPDGSRERVEFNQSTNLNIASVDAPASVPTGMATHDDYLVYRNTYYWSRTGCATGYGDYTKARIYHWLHSPDLASAVGILESTKEPLESRVWYNYAGQSQSIIVGINSLPTRVGRVLDDGTTQLRTYAYDGFGHVTNSVDRVGRTFSYLYSTNGIDLLEVRQTRAGNNELLSRMTYNTQHLPLTQTDAAGQTTTFTYNARGQLLTSTNPKGETTTNTFDSNGYLIAVDGPLPGTNDRVTATYDAYGRVQTKTDVNGYTLTFDHDALDQLIKITHPDSTYEQFTYDRLDPVVIRDRAGRQSLFEYNNVRQMTKRTDPLGRATLFQWCTCGDLSSLTDPMGRTTFWNKDVQGRVTSKQYGDGSQIQYFYEQSSSRVRQVIDEKQQVSQFAFNRDDTLKSTLYANAAVSTPGVSYTYDPDYQRVSSMTDGTGTTLYAYNPVTPSPSLGAGQLASVDGPLPNDTITYGYDELGRRISTAINGVASTVIFDAAGRIASATNALGTFGYTYAGASSRMASETFPNGQNAARSYGGTLTDNELERITYTVGATPVSEFIYGRDVPAARITSWSQQVGAQPPSIHSLGYDAANQIISAAVTNSGALLNTFAYNYDPAGNRLAELANGVANSATYNALNELTTSTASASASHTNEWDAANRLVGVTSGNERAEFTYDGLGRVASIRKLTNGVEASLRRLLWCDNELCEERDAAGSVTKRFFPQGVRLETGANAGGYFYTRDHLGSIRELTDSSGSVRARYAYDPFGRRTKLAGDLDTDFGFTGLFWANEVSLCLARLRIYDPGLGRWLSRDPLWRAEQLEGPNLYAYVGNNPVNKTDPLGLCCESEQKRVADASAYYQGNCAFLQNTLIAECGFAGASNGGGGPTCFQDYMATKAACDVEANLLTQAIYALDSCLESPCTPPKCPSASPGSPPGGNPPPNNRPGSGIAGESMSDHHRDFID